MSSILSRTHDTSKVINYLIAGYAFSLPISKAATVLFELLLLMAWVYQGDFHTKLRMLNESPFVKALYSLLALSLLAYLWSENSSFWLSFMWKYWHFLVIPVIYTSLRYDYVKHILSAFLLGMLLSEIVSYGLFFEIWKEVSPTDHSPFSPFMDHTNYSIYLVISAFILLNRIFAERGRAMMVLYSLFFISVTVNLFINNGRTGQVAFILVLVLVGVLNIKHKLRAAAIMALSGVLIFSLAYALNPAFKERADLTASDIHGMVYDGNYTGAFSRRIALWVMGTQVFKENPVIGTGIGSETSGVTKYVEKYGFSSYYGVRENDYIDYHSAFVQYAAQLGIVGLSLFVLVFISLFRLKFRSSLYYNLNITFIASYALLSMVGFSFHLMNSMVLFVLFSGLFAAISRLETEKQIVSTNAEPAPLRMAQA